MKSRERRPGRNKTTQPATNTTPAINRTPATNTTSEYSKAARGRDSALSRWLAACDSLRAVNDPDQAAQTIVDAVVGGGGLRCALWLARDRETNSLCGKAFACMPEAASVTTWRELRIPIADGQASPFARGLAAGNSGVVVRGATARWLREALDPCVRGATIWLVPVRGAIEDHGLLVLDCDASAPAANIRAAAAILAANLGLTLDRLCGGVSSTASNPALNVITETTREALSRSSLADTLEDIARGCIRSLGADRVSIWTYDESSHELSCHGQAETSEDGKAAADAPRDERLVQACIARRAPVRVPDPRGDAPSETTLPSELTAIAQPLSVFGDLVGVLLVVGRNEAQTAQQSRIHDATSGIAIENATNEVALESLDVYASCASLAILTARLYERVHTAEHRLSETQSLLMQNERLAALGEFCAKLGQEVRNPLVAMGGYARRIERALPESDPNRKHARLIAKEARRLEGLFEQQSEMARAAAPRLTRRPFNGIVQASVGLVRDDLLSRGVILEETYSEQVPELLLDQERVRQMVMNILRHAVESLDEGDTLRVETFRQQDRALLEIAHTGERPAGEIIEQLFVPFATMRPSGVGLGLAVAQQIVKEHGGEIGVRCEGDWAAIFTVSLPIRDNLERRAIRDRRATRERRGRWPPRA